MLCSNLMAQPLPAASENPAWATPVLQNSPTAIAGPSSTPPAPLHTPVQMPVQFAAAGTAAGPPQASDAETPARSPAPCVTPQGPGPAARPLLSPAPAGVSPLDAETAQMQKSAPLAPTCVEAAEIGERGAAPQLQVDAETAGGAAAPVPHAAGLSGSDAAAPAAATSARIQVDVCSACVINVQDLM